MDTASIAFFASRASCGACPSPPSTVGILPRDRTGSRRTRVSWMPTAADRSSLRASGATSMSRPSHRSWKEIRAAFCPRIQANTSARALPAPCKHRTASARTARRRRRSGTSVKQLDMRSNHCEGRISQWKSLSAVVGIVIAPFHVPFSRDPCRQPAVFRTVDSARIRQRASAGRGASCLQVGETTVWHGV